ncbi:MAG: hypothetical protein WKG07_39715 [Hymenobacter sp.]
MQFTGPLNNGNLTIGGLLRGAEAEAGWHLVGNPYPAPLDWGSVSGSQLAGADAAVYVFQSTAVYQGRYTSFTNSVGAGNGLIATGQAFLCAPARSALPAASLLRMRTARPPSLLPLSFSA